MAANNTPLDENVPEPASTQDVVPLNPIDDPFIGLTDDQLKPNDMALQEAYLVNLLVEDLSRGLFSVGRIREKYLGNAHYQPYPWLTPQKLAELLTLATNRMVNDNPIDVRFEIAGFLSSNLQLQESLYEMLETSGAQGKTRTQLDVVRALHQIKKDRVDFIEKTGLRLSEEAKDPTKPSLLPPGVTPITDLLSEGANILERTNVPDQYKGVLTAGELAQSRRDGDAVGEVEDEQDTVHPAGFLSV